MELEPTKLVAQALGVAEHLELSLKILRADAEMIADKSRDVSLLAIPTDVWTEAGELSAQCIALEAKINEMLRDLQPVLKLVQAREAVLLRECSGASSH